MRDTLSYEDRSDVTINTLVEAIYTELVLSKVNNYTVRSYRDVIVVPNIVTRGTS